MRDTDQDSSGSDLPDREIGNRPAPGEVHPDPPQAPPPSGRASGNAPRQSRREPPGKLVLRVELAAVIVAAVFGLAGAILGILGYNTARNNQTVTANQFLAEAWELMGGEPFALTIYHYESDPAKLEKARWLIEDQALVIDPKNSRAWRYLGVYYDSTGDYRKAEGAFKKAIKLEPRYARGHSNLGVVLHKLGRLQEAEEAHRNAIHLADPDEAQFHSNLAVVLGKQGKLEEAVEELKGAIELDKGNASYYCNLGQATLLLNRPFEAVDAERQAVRLDPELAQAYFHLGFALAVVGASEAAVAALQKGLDLTDNLGSFKEIRDNYSGPEQSRTEAEQALAVALERHGSDVALP